MTATTHGKPMFAMWAAGLALAVAVLVLLPPLRPGIRGWTDAGLPVEGSKVGG